MSYYNPLPSKRIRELVAAIPPSTDAEADLAAKYITMKRCCVEGVPEAHTVWLQVGCQSFRLDGYVDTPEEGAFLCWQLAKALQKIRSE